MVYNNNIKLRYIATQIGGKMNNNNIKEKPVMLRVRQGKLIQAEDLLDEILSKGFKTEECQDNGSLFFREDTHDYRMSFLDVANRLGIARETAEKYVIPQLDIVKTNWHLRKMYNPNNCRLQYLVSLASLNEYLTEVFQIEKKAISIVYSLEDDFTEEELKFIKKLGHKRGWQKKFTEACVRYNNANNNSFIWDNSLEIGMDKISEELNSKKLWSMRDILKDTEKFSKFRYSEQVYRFLDRADYVQGKLAVTENNSNSQGIRYLFDTSLETRLELDSTKYIFLSISENTYNIIRALLFVQKSLEYSINDYSTQEAEREFKKLLFSRVVEFL